MNIYNAEDMRCGDLEAELRALHSQLDASSSDVGDWKIIKIYEARLQNLPDPYNYEELSAKREAIRERIREITTELENYV